MINRHLPVVVVAVDLHLVVGGGLSTIMIIDQNGSFLRCANLTGLHYSTTLALSLCNTPLQFCDTIVQILCRALFLVDDPSSKSLFVHRSVDMKPESQYLHLSTLILNPLP